MKKKILLRVLVIVSLFAIILKFNNNKMYNEKKPDSELKVIISTQTSAKEQSKELNGIKYFYYDYKG